MAIPSSPRIPSAAKSSSPVRSDFALAYARLLSSTKTNTQAEFAAVLGVQQSTISDAKRRDSIPASWLVQLLLTRRISPEWILYGTGPQELAEVNVLDDVTIGSLGWKRCKQ